MDIVDSNVTATERMVGKRQRNLIVGIGSCLGVATLGVNVGVALPSWACAIAGAAIYLGYCASDPTRSSFLHHRRVRVPGAVLTVALAYVGALVLGKPWVTPTVFALLIGIFHGRSSATLSITLARELADLKQKILSMEARLQREQRTRSRQIPDDLYQVMDDKKAQAG